MTQGTIKFNTEMKKELQKAYDKAMKDGKDQFTFQGKQLFTAYAKYLLEYLNKLV